MKTWALPPILAVLAFCLGCNSIMQKVEKAPLYQYKADMKVTVDGRDFDGMAVTALDGEKKISIVSKAALDLLTISSCHRQFSAEAIGATGGWFGKSAGNTYTYTYSPNDIEKDGFCPIYIQAFDKKGVVAWGYLAFRTDQKMPAVTECNGTRWTFAGVSVCQSLAGFPQQIEFDRDVRFKASPACSITQVTPRKFRAKTMNGFCYATFTDGKDFHQLVLLGYSEILIRGQ